MEGAAGRHGHRPELGILPSLLLTRADLPPPSLQFSPLCSLLSHHGHGIGFRPCVFLVLLVAPQGEEREGIWLRAVWEAEPSRSQMS